MNPLEHTIESILPGVQKPSRYIGGEPNQVVKDPATATARVVWSYPDAYEIGISNQALQILYAMVNERTGAWAERAYCPWPDMADAMRREGVPLFTLESWRPVRDADMWGITLQHELCYTNVLEMLDLAGVPLHAEERTQGDPIVIGGGPCASNPEPLAPFFDAFLIGEAEDLVERIVEVFERLPDRRRRMLALANMPNVYVPSLGAHLVDRAVYDSFDIATQPSKPIVPYASAIFNRASVEVMRGCTRGCRFCHAGTWYRPVRERPAAEVVEAGAKVLDCTGYDELSFTSLATSDYTDIDDAIAGIKAIHPDLHLTLPSNRVDTGPIAMSAAANTRQASITIAPEAATQRMRNIICKTIDDEMIDGAVRAAFEQGYTSVKTYFMIGLPGETHDEVQAIVDFGVRARDIGREVLGEQARFTVHVSASNFVPKPHTAFQWEGMAPRVQLLLKQSFIRRSMPRGGGQIRLSLHDPTTSMLEGALSRGGRHTARVIERAWRSGARFDAWNELHDAAAWHDAYAQEGLTLDGEAERVFGEFEPLPWDHIRSGLSKEFLLDELWQSRAEAITGDCRWDGCTDCGACLGPIRTRVMK
ncbi:MAG: putative Fe-S oxidoreductase [Thermoleophilia bacterium]|nr:putative Fe-S oxidoreductase [Thermoleophilia bacterium]